MVANCRWVGRTQNWYDDSGNMIFSVDFTNRKLSIPSGSTFEVLGTAITVANLPTSDPAVAGKIWIGPGGILTVSAG